MQKTETHFEQIPVQTVKRKVRDITVSRTLNPNAGSQSRGSSDAVFHCPICRMPVAVETANTDAYGQAIHEECYLLSVMRKATTSRGRRAQPSS